MDGIEIHLGEAMALAAAMIWAFAVILFRKSGEAVHPIGLNLFKDVIAAVLLIPTAWLFGEVLLRPAPMSDYLLLLASGALGIGFSDTFFFKSLNALGAGLSAIVDCLYSPFIIGLSMLWLAESMDLWQLLGVTMIVSAVLSVIVERKRNTTSRKALYLGVFWGALAMATMAVSIVMVKPLLNTSPLIWVAEVRLVGGLVVLTAAVYMHPSRRAIMSSIRARQQWGYTLSGSFAGGYLAMVFWLAGMKFTSASIAAALNQTSNIFIFIFAALLLKEKVTLIRGVAIVLGVGGALLVTFG
jgi:drug/metabolite transporter (DMT)-like permease